MKLPTQLFIDVSRCCNLRCVMCDIYSAKADAAYSLNKAHVSELMDWALFANIVDEAKEFINIFVPQLRGEPLMHPRFADMVEYIREKAPQSHIWFNTNGLLLDRKLTDRLLGARVNGIGISLDAVTRDVYDQIRIGSDFERVVDNVRYLAKASRRGWRRAKTEVSVSFVLQDANRHEKKAFLKYWLPRLDRVQFYAKLEMDRRRPTLFTGAKGARGPCKSLWNSLAVHSDGIVVPCSGDLTPLEALGDAKTTPLREIAEGNRLQRLRNLHVEGRQQDIPLCAGCDSWLAYQQRTYGFSKKFFVTRSPLAEIWEGKGKK